MRYMRILPLVLGLSLVGCITGEIGSTGGPGGDDVGGDDDGGGSGSGSQTETPRLDVSVDKPAITTDLMSSNMVTVTLTGSGGFGGESVTISASVLDGTSAPLTAWTTTISAASVAVPMNGTATSVVTLNIPSQKVALTGTLQIDVTSSLGTQSMTSAVTAVDQITIPLVVNANNQCVYPAGMTKTTVTAGTKVRFLNDSTLDEPLRIHFASNAGGMAHAQVDTAKGQVYERVAAGTTDGNEWYCHTPGNNPGNLSIEVLAAP
ncbi:MAG: hypothetical protein AB7R00_32310 [Kofleriaceae bacterium]